jgi:hypothetical protein
VNLLSRRITLRARLTLIYGGLFLVAGVLLLGATYALFSQQLGSSKLTVVLRGPEVKQSTPPATGSGKKQLFVLNKAGDVLTGADAERAIKDQQDGVRAAATRSLLTQGGIALLLVGGLAAGFGWLVAGRTTR